MNRQSFVMEWTGQVLNVGLRGYAMTFQPDPGYPSGLRLDVAWCIWPNNCCLAVIIDPLHVPDPEIETARAEGADAISRWGRKTGCRLLSITDRQPLWYNPVQSPMRTTSDVQDLLLLMGRARKEVRR